MKRSLLLLFIIFFVSGCKSKNSIPGGVLSQKKMQLVLWDMMRADQFLADYVLNKDTSLNKTTESLKQYEQIFAIHKVSKDEFRRSFSFYQNHPVLFKAIMDSINAPEKTTPIAPVQAEPLTDSIIPLTDTAPKIPIEILPDTVRPFKKVRRLAIK